MLNIVTMPNIVTPTRDAVRHSSTHCFHGLRLCCRTFFMSEPLLQTSVDGRSNASINSVHCATMATTSPRTYPGEDNRPTSKRELWAWYSYCFATEVYAVVSLSMSSHDTANCKRHTSR